MKPYIHETITDLQAKIDQYRQAVNLLQMLDDGPCAGAVAAVPVQTLAAKAQEVKPQRAARPAAAKRTETGPRARRSPQETIAEIGALPEPFGRVEMIEALGLSHGGAGSQIDRFVTNGWLKKVAPGRYARTSKYPGARPVPQPAAAMRIPGLDPEALTLSEQLEKALRDRDAARARNEVGLVKILQDKIAKIEAELAA